jgi:hypothetical protein
MPQLISKTIRASTEAWQPMPLGSDGFTLPGAGAAGANAAAMIARVAPASWCALAASDDVFVNGDRVRLGVRILRDRDEIRIGGVSHFFSTESLACVEAYSGDGIQCARCQTEIASAQAAVRCPQCAVWHHEDPQAQLPCWSYRDRCARCPQPTALDGTYRWLPEEEWG